MSDVQVLEKLLARGRVAGWEATRGSERVVCTPTKRKRPTKTPLRWDGGPPEVTASREPSRRPLRVLEGKRARAAARRPAACPPSTNASGGPSNARLFASLLAAAFPYSFGVRDKRAFCFVFFFFVFTCAVDGPWTFWQERLRPEIKWGIIGRVCFLGGCTRHDWFLLPWCVRNGTFLNGTKCRRLGQLVTSATGSGRGQIGLGHASCDVRSD